MSGEYSKGRERGTTWRERIDRLMGKRSVASVEKRSRNDVWYPLSGLRNERYDALWDDGQAHRDDPRVILTQGGYSTDGLPDYYVDVALLPELDGGLPGVYLGQREGVPTICTPHITTVAEGLAVLDEIEQHGPEKVDAKYSALFDLQRAERDLESQQGTPEYCDARTEKLVGEIKALQREIVTRQAEIKRLKRLRAASPAREAECVEVVAARRAEYEAAVAQLEAPDA